MTETSPYYKEVGDYFDLFAEKHSAKSEDNPILTGMRNSFRSYVTHPSPKNILDIGCGTGLDAAYFAEKYPSATVYGIDVSAGMIACAKDLARQKNLPNTVFLNTGIETLREQLDSSIKFDVIYVFFGALNTVNSLPAAAAIIKGLLNPGGHAVLTFVNKYYLSEFFINAAKGKFVNATARWKTKWRGYSPEVALASNTYTPATIEKAFTDLSLKKRKGYSIFYPAWFQASWLKKYPRLCSLFKKLDTLANNTFLWKNGEYTLYVYENS